MNKLIIITLLILGMSVKADEVTYITTNEYNQVTKVVELTKNDITKTIVFIDNDFVVPMKYRVKWSTMSDGEKLQVMMELNEQSQEVPLVYPKKVESEPVVFRDTPDEEIRVVKLRDEEEGE